MVQLVKQQSDHTVGFVLRQLSINCSLTVPTHADAFERGDGLQPPLKVGSRSRVSLFLVSIAYASLGWHSNPESTER